MPIAEAPSARAGLETPLPRILLQAACRNAASRRVAMLALLFLLLGALEAALLLRLGESGPLVVYHIPPRRTLLEIERR
jgi:hypothetical protein